MPHKNRSLFFLLTLFATFVSCKSVKTVGTGNPNFNLSTKQLIRENSKQSPRFKTLSSRVKINIDQEGKTDAYTINFRMEKDKQILLMSTPISVVKALITPEKVSFYNKLDNTYFDGDYKYLSHLLGIDLDFQKVQNLLLGEALFGLKAKAFNMTVDDKSYILEPKDQEALFELFYLIDPHHFKISSQQISQPQEQRLLEIDYLKYQEVGKQILPQQIKIVAVEAARQMILEMEFKAVSLNEALRFPFKIPSGYKEIKW